MKEGALLDFLFVFGNAAGVVLGANIFDNGLPVVGGWLAAVSAFSMLRLGLNYIWWYKEFQFLDLIFAIIFLFGLYEGACWIGYDQDGLFAVGVVMVIVCLCALGRMIANYIDFD